MPEPQQPIDTILKNSGCTLKSRTLVERVKVIGDTQDLDQVQRAWKENGFRTADFITVGERFEAALERTWLLKKENIWELEIEMIYNDYEPGSQSTPARSEIFIYTTEKEANTAFEQALALMETLEPDLRTYFSASITERAPKETDYENNRLNDSDLTEVFYDMAKNYGVKAPTETPDAPPPVTETSDPTDYFREFGCDNLGLSASDSMCSAPTDCLHGLLQIPRSDGTFQCAHLTPAEMRDLAGALIKLAATIEAEHAARNT